MVNVNYKASTQMQHVDAFLRDHASSSNLLYSCRTFVSLAFQHVNPHLVAKVELFCLIYPFPYKWIGSGWYPGDFLLICSNICFDTDLDGIRPTYFQPMARTVKTKIRLRLRLFTTWLEFSEMM